MMNEKNEVREVLREMLTRDLRITVSFVNQFMVVPQYATIGSAGFDLQANTVGPIEIHSGEVLLIPTGIKAAVPFGHELQIRPRSGLALKHGITVLNAPGTIDSDYRGDIGVILHNVYKAFGSNVVTIEPGTRIAQAVLAEHRIADFKVVYSLDETVRGEGGFGSSGE